MHTLGGVPVHCFFSRSAGKSGSLLNCGGNKEASSRFFFKSFIDAQLVPLPTAFVRWPAIWMTRSGLSLFIVVLYIVAAVISVPELTERAGRKSPRDIGCGACKSFCIHVTQQTSPFVLWQRHGVTPSHARTIITNRFHTWRQRLHGHRVGRPIAFPSLRRRTCKKKLVETAGTLGRKGSGHSAAEHSLGAISIPPS